MGKGRYNASRSAGDRRPNSIITIVCDDTDTAPAYFQIAATREVGSKRFRIVNAPRSGATAGDVIHLAQQEAAARESGDDDAVWVLIDLEMAPDSRMRTEQFRARAQDVGVNLALSQPCFEVWILAHFESTGRHFGNCGAVLDAVKRAWKDAFDQPFPQKKAQADYRKISDRVDQAVGNARTHQPPNSQSWTEVWKIFADE